MKKSLALIVAVFVLGALAEAKAQTVIDAQGLTVDGEMISPQGSMWDGQFPPNTPAELWLGQSNGYLRSCDSAGICTLQSDLGGHIRSMAVFNSQLWIGLAGGEVRSCDSSGICRQHPKLGADVVCMQIYGGKLWMGLDNGELKSCDRSGTCSDHGNQGGPIFSMAVFDGKLWTGLADGPLRSCDLGGNCVAAGQHSGTVLEMVPFEGKLWLGQINGVLKSCDSKGVCAEHDSLSEAVRAMVVFDDKLWVGRSDGYLKACNGSGVCGDLWDYGNTIEAMAVFNGRVWVVQGAQLLSSYQLGTFETHGDFGSDIGKIAVFSRAGMGRTLHTRWNCVGTDQGCVGLGIANPVDLLQIHQVDETHRAYLNFTNPLTGSSDGNGVSIGLDQGEDFRIHSYESNNLKFYTDNAERLRIDSQGNVGIGTDTPAGKLDVNGPIYQRGAQLHADYVFDPSYRIESVEAHADFMWREKHLKAVPKARIDENGLQVLEMGAHRRGMLEELEKAHVYIQQLHQQVKNLHAKNAALERIVCEIRPEAPLCRDLGP